MSKAKRFRVQLVKSPIGYDRRQRTCLRGLGLRKLNQSVELVDEPGVRGLVDKVRHLVRVEG
jgi:large subunit ribosomal protein L30